MTEPLRQDLLQTVHNAIGTVLSMNFALMGVEPGRVPPRGRTGNVRARAYLFGLTQGVMLQFRSMSPTGEELEAAFLNACAATYGRTEWEWSCEAVLGWQRKRQDALDGVLIGNADAVELHSDKPWRSCTGLRLLTKGDEKAVRARLAELRA